MVFGHLKEKPTPRHSPSNPFADLLQGNNNVPKQARQATRASTPEGPVDSPGNPFGPLANGELPGAYPLTERKAAPRKSPTIQMKPKKKKPTDMRFLQEPSTSAVFSALKPTLLFMEAHRIYRERAPKFNPLTSARKDASVNSNPLEGSEASSAKSKRKASPAPKHLRSFKQPPAKRRISDTQPTATVMEPPQKVTTNDCRNQTVSSRNMGVPCGTSQDTKSLEHKYASSERGVKGNTASKIKFNQKTASNDSHLATNTASFKITDKSDENGSQQKYPTESEIARCILEVARESGHHDLLALNQSLFLDIPQHISYMEQQEQRLHKSGILPWLLGALRQEYRLRQIQKKLNRLLRDEELECINQACILATFRFVNSGQDEADPASSTSQRTTGAETTLSLSCKDGADIFNKSCSAMDKGKRLSGQEIDGTLSHQSQGTMPLLPSKGSPEPHIFSERGSKKRGGTSSAPIDELKRAARLSENAATRHQHNILSEKNPFDEEPGSEVEMENAKNLETCVTQIKNGLVTDGILETDLESGKDDHLKTRAIEDPPMDPIDNTLSDEDADSEAAFPDDNSSESNVAQHEHTIPLDETSFDEESSSDVELENVHNSDKSVIQDKQILPKNDALFDEESCSGFKSEVEHDTAYEEPFSEEEHDGSEVADSEAQEDPANNESEFEIYEDEEEYPYANPSSRPSSSCSVRTTGTAIRPVDPKLTSQPVTRSYRLPIDLANARAAADIARGPQYDPSMDNPFIDRPKTEAYSEAIDEEYSESEEEDEY